MCTDIVGTTPITESALRRLRHALDLNSTDPSDPIALAARAVLAEAVGATTGQTPTIGGRCIYCAVDKHDDCTRGACVCDCRPAAATALHKVQELLRANMQDGPDTVVIAIPRRDWMRVQESIAEVLEQTPWAHN